MVEHERSRIGKIVVYLNSYTLFRYNLRSNLFLVFLPNLFKREIGWSKQTRTKRTNKETKGEQAFI